MPDRSKRFSLPHRSRVALTSTQSSVQWERLTLFLEIKRHISKSTTSFCDELKNTWNLLPHPPYFFMRLHFVTHRNNFSVESRSLCSTPSCGCSSIVIHRISTRSFFLCLLRQQYSLNIRQNATLSIVTPDRSLFSSSSLRMAN